MNKTKKGVSIVIGYVLLVSLAVIMGGVLYAWMKSYIPKEPLECPEGVSITIKEYNYNCTNLILNLTLRNNGRFNVTGYFIHAINDSNYSLATIDLSAPGILIDTGNVSKYGSAILLGGGNENNFGPGDETINQYDLTSVGQIYSIELTPVRWQKEGRKLRFVSCGSVSTSKEVLSCTS